MPDATTAREYLRVSADKSGRGASVAQQHAENEAVAASHGWTLLTPYSEPEAVSASRYSQKAREAFTNLLDDIEAGRFGASVLMLWESSRGSRRTGEWVDLIDVCAAAGVRIHVTTHHRTYEPSNARDRRTLLEDAVDSEYESAKLSGRVTRALAANASAGRPHGRIPWGYRRIYDQRTGALVRQEPDPTTGPLVSELFERIRSGDSVRSIERDWSARGIVNKSGRPFGGAHLRSLLDVRAYVGDRVHGDSVYPGDWEPLVSRETWRAVHAILADPTRRTNRPGRGIYDVSMIARCGVCGGPMVGDRNVDNKHRKAPVYRCQSNHVTISMEDLNRYVLSNVGAYLALPDVRSTIEAASADSDALGVARDALAGVQDELDDLYEQAGTGALSATALAVIEPRLLARKAEAEDVVDRLARPSALVGLLGDSPGKALGDLSVERRRAVYALICTRDMLGVPTIQRAGKTGPNQPPVKQRVRWDRVE